MLVKSSIVVIIKLEYDIRSLNKNLLLGKKLKTIFAFKKYPDKFTSYESFFNTSKTSYAICIRYLKTINPKS